MLFSEIKSKTNFLLNYNQEISRLRALFIFCCLIGTLIAFNSSELYAQGPVNGSFIGRVIDIKTNTPIPNATVTFKNIDRGFQTAARTDANGYFSRTALPPGNYEIEVKADGYLPKMQKQSLYATRSNDVVPVPFAMEKADAGNTVPQPVQTPQPTQTNAATSQADSQNSDEKIVNLNSRRDGAFNLFSVFNLPLGGTTLTRTFDELALLIPGVNPAPQAIGSSVGPGVGGGVGTSGQFAVNGLRSRANNFTVDGSDNNDEDIGVRRQGFFTLVPQPIESIQEFQIITLLAPAQFGRNLGAQVNALSKSGSNRFNGSVFGLFNSDKLNSANYFDRTSGDVTTPLQGRRFFDGALIPVFLNNQQVQVTNDAGEKDKTNLIQGGFAVGGRIVPDKLFFFASGEGQFLDATREKHFAVPTIEQRGLFGTGAQGLFLNNAAGTTPLFPTALESEAVFSLFPFPNDPNGIFGRNTYTQELSADARGRMLSGKVDYNFGLRGQPQTLTARYNYTDDKRDLTDVGGAIYSAVRPLVRTDNFSTYLTGGISTNISNEFRFSWGRTRLRFDELRDSYLRPLSSGRFSNPDDARFMLNVPFLVNSTIASCPANDPPPCPGSSIIYANRVDYFSSGTTETQRLGPIGQLIIAGFSPVGVDVFNFPQERKNNTYQFADTLRWQIKQHSVSFGADIRRTYLDSNLPRNSRPLVTFNGGPDLSQFGVCGQAFCAPTDFASAAAATGFFQTLSNGTDANIKLSYFQLNFFVQDEWRVRPNVNFNFGLRYELNTTPKEADGKIENTFGATLPTFIRGLSNFIDGRTKIFESDTNNFAPRIGLAYAPTSKTVIRAGFGMYFDQILGAVVSQSRNVFPNFVTANFGGGVLIDNPTSGGQRFTFFNPLFAIFDPVSGFICNARDISPACVLNRSIPLIQPGTLNTINPAINQTQLQAALQDIFVNFPFQNGNPYGATLPTRNLDTPVSYQYSIGVEHKWFRDNFVSVAYVGTMGRELLRFNTPNLGSNYIAVLNNFVVNPNCTGTPASTGGGNPAECEPITLGTTFDPNRPVSNVGTINQFETTGRSRYDALQLSFRGRLSQFFQYQIAYSYGNVKDDVSDVFDLAGSFALPQNSLTFAGEYAPANFDVRHRLTYNFIYGLPRLQGKNSVLRFIFGDWQFAASGKFNTGQPFTVNTIFDVNLDGNLTDRLNSTDFITQGTRRSRPLSLSCSSVAQCQSMLADFGDDGAVSRNSFRAGDVLDLDISFSKRFTVTESQNVQFRVDVFNFINRANFGVPVRFLEFPSFGQATETITPGRRIQFVLRYNF